MPKRISRAVSNRTFLPASGADATVVLIHSTEPVNMESAE